MPSPRVAPFEPVQLWQRAREPLFWLDPALRFSWVNRAWEELTGHPSESIMGLTCVACGATGAGDLADLAASFFPPAEALAGRPSGTRALIFRPGSDGVWHRLEFWPFRDDTDTLIGILGVVRGSGDEPSVRDAQGSALHIELLEIRRQSREQPGAENLVGLGPSHRRLLDQVHVAAATTKPVLILGEPGTGKRQVARAIHQSGSSRERPLFSFDCEALPAEILERELFGLERTGASRAASSTLAGGSGRARLTILQGSTLLLREILTLPRDLQVLLVAALEAPIRLLATTATPPAAALEIEAIRPELYFALTTCVIQLEPLRQRRDELPLLAQHFLERANERGGTPRVGFSPEAITALLAYDWPGNLRELARVIDHAHGQPGGQAGLVAIDDLPGSIRGSLGGGFSPPRSPFAVKPLDALLIEVERRAIETALRLARGNKSRAADLLGISRPRLYRRGKELGLPDDAPSDDPEAPA